MGTHNSVGMVRVTVHGERKSSHAITDAPSAVRYLMTTIMPITSPRSPAPTGGTETGASRTANGSAIRATTGKRTASVGMREALALFGISLILGSAALGMLVLMCRQVERDRSQQGKQR